ncbi:purine/pyrimidine permease [Lentibacillus sp. Marseille-P4043]|uniref:purine/pyrimidine permease n=1 Tax=Lentibacillus sp. Marseille-P4043 TaxID=2040293 RepID=UPI000D0BDFCC|nr:purine/pyrimidine permease [Lentibacillus sp. Marseille-P4043]
MSVIFSSLQWALFILMSSVVIPVAIASSYGLDAISTVEFVQRTLFVLGIAGILQALFGHRLPVQEGPAGLWWGVFSLYAGLGSVLFGSQLETLRVLQYAFLLSGVIFIVLSVLGLVKKLARLFTPTVVGIYLILMVAQLSGSFLQGMFGLSGDSKVVDGKVLLLSFIIVILSYGFMKLPRVGHYSVLFSIIFGWILFAVFGLSKPVTMVNSFIKLPEVFAFGSPRIEANMIIMVIFITLLLLANMLATVSVVQQVLECHHVPVEKDRLKQTGIISGINQLLAGFFSAIGAVPVSGSAGFIETSKITSKKPFIIGSLLIVAISLFPPVTSFVAAIPEAVGYAAIFPVFASIISLALQEFEGVENKGHVFQVVGISLFAGIGVMFIPSQAFSAMPPTLVSVLSNGLVFGAIIAVITEAVLTKMEKKQGETAK